MQAARRKQILPYVQSDSNLHVGVHHLPHSKSDANFMAQGGSYGNQFVLGSPDVQNNTLITPQVCLAFMIILTK